jgi:DNA-binding transcriptional ArsR family regulator
LNEARAYMTTSAERRVTDPAAVQLLWQPRRRLHLRPFLGRSASLAEAARLLGLKKPAMAYWIRRLLALGLIEPVAPGRERGRDVPRYRCVADRLRVSLAQAPLDSHEAVFAETDALWQQRLRPALARCMARQSGQVDLVLHASDSAGLGSTLETSPGAAPRDECVHVWGRLWLAAAERDALRAELDALFDRYAALSDRGRKTAVTLLHLAMAPDQR